MSSRYKIVRIFNIIQTELKITINVGRYYTLLSNSYSLDNNNSLLSVYNNMCPNDLHDKILPDSRKINN